MILTLEWAYSENKQNVLVNILFLYVKGTIKTKHQYKL